MYNGIINVYKEAGYTSHDVVARLRGICKQKKIGHTGTLDPDAVGVLPVCLGNGTRLCDMLTDRQKEYVAVLRLGLATDTQDISGKVLSEKEVTISPEDVKKIIMSFQGDLLQTPPMYSALKVNGQKLYELARQGKEVERVARPITVYEIEILEEAHPDYTIRVSCSKGTYIRTLCHDIGQQAGCGAVMASLTRTRVGEFKIEDAYTISRLEEFAKEETLSERVTSVEKMFESLMDILVKEDGMKALNNGNQLTVDEISSISGKAVETLTLRNGQEFKVYSFEKSFFGIYKYEESRKLFSPVKMFFPS